MTEKKTSSLTLVEIAAQLAPFGVDLTNEQMEAIRQYVQLLLLWNEKVSLTSVRDCREIVARHFGESLYAAQLTDLSHGRLADVGTGAGFPGLPLKIGNPALGITLVEPNAKKIAFLKEIVGGLRLDGVHIVRSGYAETAGMEGSFDFVCSRALGQYSELLDWSRGALRRSGMALFWVGEEDAAFIQSRAGWQWEPANLIPASKRRLLLIGRPSGE